MIESIGERSQMIKEAVAIATGVDIPDFMVGNNYEKQQIARRLAVDLYVCNLGFMGKWWIGRQLGYKFESVNLGGIGFNKVEQRGYDRAQALYDQMVKEAKQ